MKKIIVITSIKPDPINRGGEPSGFIWEIVEYLKKNGYFVDIMVVERSKFKIVDILNRYAIYFNKVKGDFEKYDKILVYRSNIALYLPKKYRYKVITLGPDSMSLLEARLYKENNNILIKLMKIIYYYIAIIMEYCIIRDVNKYIVVGKTDRLWIINNFFLKRNKNLRKKICFLRHPILKNVVFDNLYDNIKKTEKKRFIFSGDFDKRFNKKFLIPLFNILRMDANSKNIKMNFVVLGKRNKWIAEELKKISSFDICYLDWIEDYKEVCIIGQDIHCLPMLVGAGTKNRTLIALANGLEVITTSIGIENIMYKDLSNVYVTNSINKFANYMEELNDKFLSDEELKVLIEERLNFRKSVEKAYTSGIDKIINLKD